MTRPACSCSRSWAARRSAWRSAGSSTGEDGGQAGLWRENGRTSEGCQLSRAVRRTLRADSRATESLRAASDDGRPPRPRFACQHPRLGAARAGPAAGQGPPPLLLPRDVHPPGHQRTQRGGLVARRDRAGLLDAGLALAPARRKHRGTPAHRRARATTTSPTGRPTAGGSSTPPTATMRSSFACSIHRAASPPSSSPTAP